MNCPRCGSIMILKKFYDYGGYVWVWKCIFCGEITDLVQEESSMAQKGWEQNTRKRGILCDDM
jgi:DNA-directed RNA polymerase subunit RPC12/RpoP